MAIRPDSSLQDPRKESNRVEEVWDGFPCVLPSECSLVASKFLEKFLVSSRFTNMTAKRQREGKNVQLQGVLEAWRRKKKMRLIPKDRQRAREAENCGLPGNC
jgi:hypothetical protein